MEQRDKKVYREDTWSSGWYTCDCVSRYPCVSGIHVTNSNVTLMGFFFDEYEMYPPEIRAGTQRQLRERGQRALSVESLQGMDVVERGFYWCAVVALGQA